MSSAPDVLHAWEVLLHHHALMWTPPMWRDVAAAGPCPHTIRAVEQNLLVSVVPNRDGGCRFRLGTGPLRDRDLGDGFDPVAPAPVRDARLDVEAATFESALCELADRVVDVYGPTTPAATTRPRAAVSGHFATDGSDGQAARTRRAVRR